MTEIWNDIKYIYNDLKGTLLGLIVLILLIVSNT